MDERAALVSDLQGKRERLNEEAHRQREMRDRLNDGTRAHAGRRDDLNAQVRGVVERANAHKTRRDELNAQVREAKVKRDELNREAHAKSEALATLRKDRGHAPGVPPGKLRAEIRRLEFEQQTKALAPKKEKELIDLIAAKQRELKERESSLQENDETRAAYEAMKSAKAAAEAQHQAVTALANEAQSEHDSMVKLFGEADQLRRLADAAQADFVKSKTEADRVHKEYIESVNAIRDIDRVNGALRGRPTSTPQAEATQAQADEIFDKFRKGEKLSTEDLMALQKAGRL